MLDVLPSSLLTLARGLQSLDRRRRRRCGHHRDHDNRQEDCYVRALFPFLLAPYGRSLTLLLPFLDDTSSTTKKAAATATASSTETDANGVVLPASGTQLNYSQFSSLVASPLKSAYEATASSAGSSPSLPLPLGSLPSFFSDTHADR